MGYTLNAGLLELQRAIARHLGLSESDRERIIVTCGSAGALSSVTGALIAPGDVVLTPDPSYPAYADLIGMFPASIAAYSWRMLEKSSSKPFSRPPARKPED